MDQVPDLRDMSMDRRQLVEHLLALFAERLDVLDAEISSTRSAFTSDTKSSAGDKHEVGRAMVQQELDKLEEQRSKLIGHQQEIDRVPLDRNYEQVSFGCLVSTDQGTYFIAIGLGAVEVGGSTLYVISLASPMGQALKDRRPGDLLTFNGKAIKVLNIT